MKRKIAILIIIQLFIIVLILWSFLNKKVYTSSNPHNSDNLTSNTSEKFPNFYEPKPNSSETASLKFMGAEYDYLVKYQINSDGMNQLKNFPIKKERETFRIVTLGDSFTFGENVNTFENYPSVLQRILDKECSSQTKFEVLNLGVSGYDIQYSIERLKNRGLKYEPDLVLWLVAVDQLSRVNRLTAEKSRGFLREMKSTEEGRKELEKKPYAFIVRAKNAVVNELGESKILAMQEEYLNEIRLHYDYPVLFLTFDGKHIKDTHKNLLRKISSTNPNIFFYEKISDIYKMDGVLPDFHPSSKGYQIIAEDVFNYLKDSNLIDCR